ncbi:MAG: ATP-binding protein [Armatimonadota bacterium]
MATQFQQIAVVSGKGGTGKTTLLASWATLAREAVLADCDVDAANLHLLLRPELQEAQDFYGANVAVRDPALCNRCGECERRCRFAAISTTEVDALACEGCGLCVLVCPRDALRLEPALTGRYFLSQTPYGPFSHARLYPGAESSGRLVTVVRKQAEDLALARGTRLILLDGPPGVGCTAVASITEVNLVIAVTEPTLSGIHDMERVVALARGFRLPVAAVINKADINLRNAARIEKFCRAGGIPVLARLPFDPIVTKYISACTPLVEYDDGPVSQGLRRAWQGALKLLAAGG